MRRETNANGKSHLQGVVDVLSRTYIWKHKPVLFMVLAATAYVVAKGAYVFVLIQALAAIAIEILYATVNLDTDSEG